MRKYFKRAAALLLTGLMAVTSAPRAVYATEEGAALLPLRMVFEAEGAVISWDYEAGAISALHNGVEFLFTPQSHTAERDGVPFQLSRPVVIDQDSRARIAFDDIAFLFESEEGLFPNTKQTAVETAYQFLEAFNIPGMTISVVHRDSGYTWTQGIGFADVAGSRYVNEMTLFDMGSIAKVFAAISVMQLVEEGLIDLDEPITTYLPGFTVQPHPVHGGDYRNITARMLLSHFSGLPVDFFGGMMTTDGHYQGFMNNFLYRMADAHMDNAELVRMAYANNAFTLVGVLVAYVTGNDNFFEGYANFVQENILTPAQMDSTTFFITQYSYKALPHDLEGLAAELVFASPLSAGGLFSNAHDMARFMHIILNGGSFEGGQILNPASVNEMFTVQNFDQSLNPQVRTGLGTLHMTHQDGFTSSGHDGNIIHYHSAMQFDFEAGIGVFISTNGMGGAAASTALAHAVLSAAVYEKTGVSRALQPLPPGVPTELAREVLEGFAGFYTAIGRLSIDEDNNLYATLPGLPIPLIFTPYEDGSFGSLLGRFWIEELDGRMVVFQGDHRLLLVAERIDNPWQADENFERWTGTYLYYSEIPGALELIPFITIAVDDDGYAVLILGEGSHTPIGKIDDNTFHILGTGRNLGMVIRLSEVDGTDWLYIAGTRFVRGE